MQAQPGKKTQCSRLHDEDKHQIPEKDISQSKQKKSRHLEKSPKVRTLKIVYIVFRNRVHNPMISTFAGQD